MGNIPSDGYQYTCKIMDVLLSILALLFIIIGIIGCIVPILPGVALAYVGYLCCYFCSFSQISTTAVWVYLALTIAVSVLDYILPAYMTKLSGGSKAGQRGATAGLIAGMLLGSIVGAIIGPFVGAVVGELINDGKDTSRAIKVGIGSFFSFLVGTGLKVILSFVMLLSVFGDILPVIRDWFVNLF